MVVVGASACLYSVMTNDWNSLGIPCPRDSSISHCSLMAAIRLFFAWLRWKMADDLSLVIALFFLICLAAAAGFYLFNY